MTPNGTAIKAIRVARDLSIPELAARVGRDRTYLWRVERGEAGASAETLRRLAEALEVPVAAINREELS